MLNLESDAERCGPDVLQKLGVNVVQSDEQSDEQSAGYQKKYLKYKTKYMNIKKL